MQRASHSWDPPGSFVMLNVQHWVNVSSERQVLISNIYGGAGNQSHNAWVTNPACYHWPTDLLPLHLSSKSCYIHLDWLMTTPNYYCVNHIGIRLCKEAITCLGQLDNFGGGSSSSPLFINYCSWKMWKIEKARAAKGLIRQTLFANLLSLKLYFYHGHLSWIKRCHWLGEWQLFQYGSDIAKSEACLDRAGKKII